MKPKLVFATTNEGKLTELRALMGDRVQVISARDAAPTLDVDEDQPDFIGNARKKARAFCEVTRLPALADDSGLCIDALGGAPGVISARWAKDDAARIARALAELEQVEDSKRTARFVCALCLALPSGAELVEKGRCEGRITRAARGTKGFGYDPIFEVTGLGKTMAELSVDEKSAHSHRGNAFRALLPQMVEALKG